MRKKHQEESKKMEESKNIDASIITLNSSLGLLAYGDIAFTAWRELKIKNRQIENE